MGHVRVSHVPFILTPTCESKLLLRVSTDKTRLLQYQKQYYRAMLDFVVITLNVTVEINEIIKSN